MELIENITQQKITLSITDFHENTPKKKFKDKMQSYTAVQCNQRPFKLVFHLISSV